MRWASGILLSLIGSSVQAIRLPGGRSLRHNNKGALVQSQAKWGSGKYVCADDISTHPLELAKGLEVNKSLKISTELLNKDFVLEVSSSLKEDTKKFFLIKLTAGNTRALIVDGKEVAKPQGDGKHVVMLLKRKEGLTNKLEGYLYDQKDFYNKFEQTHFTFEAPEDTDLDQPLYLKAVSGQVIDKNCLVAYIPGLGTFDETKPNATASEWSEWTVDCLTITGFVDKSRRTRSVTYSQGQPGDEETKEEHEERNCPFKLDACSAEGKMLGKLLDTSDGYLTWECRDRCDAREDCTFYNVNPASGGCELLKEVSSLDANKNTGGKQSWVGTKKRCGLPEEMLREWRKAEKEGHNITCAEGYTVHVFKAYIAEDNSYVITPKNRIDNWGKVYDKTEVVHQDYVTKMKAPNSQNKVPYKCGLAPYNLKPEELTIENPKNVGCALVWMCKYNQ